MISIIVPIYNVENYIKECIDSILNQSYTNFELLLIDDGSTDSSFNICKKYESIDRRVKVYQKNNGGVSSARNMGLEKATGEWITFIDSDDYLLNNHFLEDLEKATHYLNIDYCITSGCTKFGQEKIVFNQPGVQLSTNSILKHIIGLNQIYLSPWGRLFKTSIINNNKIRFLEGLHYAEDCYFNIEYLNHVKQSSVVDNKGYYYRENSSSITHNYRSYTHYLEFLTNLFKQYHQFKHTYKIHQIDDYFIGFHLIGNSLSIIQDLYHSKYNYKERRKAIETLKEIISKTDKKYTKYLTNYKIKIKFKIILLPFYISNLIHKVIYGL